MASRARAANRERKKKDPSSGGGSESEVRKGHRREDCLMLW